MEPHICEVHVVLQFFVHITPFRPISGSHTHSIMANNQYQYKADMA